VLVEQVHFREQRGYSQPPSTWSVPASSSFAMMREWVMVDIRSLAPGGAPGAGGDGEESATIATLS
jgi:hypothetical protein